MVILRARVGSAEPENEHRTDAASHDERAERADESFVPQWVEIEKSGNRFILVSIDQKGWRYIETSSASIEEAKADAAEQFSVDMDAWVPVTEKVARRVEKGQTR